MSTEIFNPTNFKNISESEYNYAKNNLNDMIFSHFYRKGMFKNIDNKLIFSTANTNKDIKVEQEAFIAYDFSMEQKEKLFQYFNEEIMLDKFDKKNPVFSVISEQVKNINLMIEPVLNDLGIKYQLVLAGGSLRDHLLNKQIKDLDVLIEFNDNFQLDKQMGRNSVEKLEAYKEKMENFFLEKSSVIKKYQLNIFHGQSREKILHEIIFQTMNKMQQTEVKEFFWEFIEKEKTEEQKQQKELTEDDSVIYEGLFSVIKLNSQNFTYPVDLLLNSNTQVYLNSFDFELCKCAYYFKTLYSHKNDKNFNPLYLSEGFINDTIHSTLSLNTNIFSEEKQVDRCLSDHYLRLQKKYPEYEIKLINTELNANKELLNYIEKAKNYYLLNDKLKPKEIKNKVKKI